MTYLRRRNALPAAGALSVAAVAMVLAGCGSSTPSYGSSSNTTPTQASAPSGGDRETISTTTGGMGTYLTGDHGRAIYLWEGDHGSSSSCTGACASVWPPVTTDGTPKASGGAKASDLGTIKRSDGSMQVTYQGHPLYYYAADTSSGQTSGQGSNGFGAKWWLVMPSGSPITGSGSAPSQAPSSTATSNSGGGYTY